MIATTYSYTIDRSHGFEVHRFVVRSGVDVLPLRKLYDGAIGNKAGYGSPEIAARFADEAMRAMADGYLAIAYQSFATAAVHVAVQRYDATTFCEPSIDSLGGRTCAALEASLKLAKTLKLTDGMTPEALVKRLEKLGACQLDGVEVGNGRLLAKTGNARDASVRASLEYGEREAKRAVEQGTVSP